MTTTPYARVQVSLNGGGVAQGGVNATLNQTVQFSLVDTTGVAVAKWELFAFPPSFPTPAGWTAVNGVPTYFGLIPPAFVASLWGKYLVSCEVNGKIKNGQTDEDCYDEGTAVSIASVGGLLDLAYRESTQFGEWAKGIRANWRTIESLLGAAGWTVVSAAKAGVMPLFSGAGVAITDGTTPSWGKITAPLCGADVTDHPAQVPVLTGWSYNTEGNPAQDSASSAGTVTFPVAFTAGRNVQSVSVQLIPVTHTGLPATLPKIRFERRLMNGSAVGSWALVDVFSETVDASATFSAYNLLHRITSTGNSAHTFDSNYEYRVVVAGETGTNSLAGLRILGNVQLGLA